MFEIMADPNEWPGSCCAKRANCGVPNEKEIDELNPIAVKTLFRSAFPQSNYLPERLFEVAIYLWGHLGIGKQFHGLSLSQCQIRCAMTGNRMTDPLRTIGNRISETLRTILRSRSGLLD
jgi:hypothetical protein